MLQNFLQTQVFRVGDMKIKSTATAVSMAFLMVSGLIAGVSVPASAAGTTYFVSAAGSDSNSGTSSTAAWRTLSKLNQAVLKPGDTVSFRRGDTFTGGIVTAQSGSATAPITLNSYGTGNAPIVTGGKSGNCIRINGSYTIVRASARLPADMRESASPATATPCGTPARPTMRLDSKWAPAPTSANTREIH
jgi:hypothetical protein